ncbi:hypothetical protein ZWY2020_045089 [Hordeum vulgare]|nr:hypothetical protein ZWY2020_045089 [Hordeum vulgare]
MPSIKFLMGKGAKVVLPTIWTRKGLLVLRDAAPNTFSLGPMPQFAESGDTQEEAAEAYDIVAIKFWGLNAVTNFDMTRYDVKSILDSTALPIGSAAKRLKDAEAATTSSLAQQQHHHADVVSGYDIGALAAYGATYHHHHPSVVGATAWPTIAACPSPSGIRRGGHMYHPYAHARPAGGARPDHAVIAAQDRRSSTTSTSTMARARLLLAACPVDAARRRPHRHQQRGGARLNTTAPTRRVQ